MGHIVHHAIVVTSYEEGRTRKAREKAHELGCEVTNYVESKINGYVTFLVCPDGSKTGWADSDAGDLRRDAFIDWLKTQRFEDGSSPFSWCEVEYGSDNEEAFVTRHEWQP